MPSPSQNKGDLPLPPPSPAFASTSALLRPEATRPEHFAVSLPSTSPLVSPPSSPAPPAPFGAGSRAPSPLPEFSDKYGGYSSPAHSEGQSSPLLASTGGSGSHSGRGLGSRHRKPKTSPMVMLIMLVAGMCGLALFITLLARLAILPSSRDQFGSQLAPFMPASVASLLSNPDGTPAAPHPIIPLISQANSEWSTMLASQSTTFDRASKTYKSRYGLPPPPGFDKWFAFATQGRNHSLVDEYDTLMADLKPYRSLSPTELRRRTAELAQVPGISIVSIRNGVAQVHSKSGKWAPALAFQQMLGAFVRDLPDMDIAVNEKPEGRVLPRQHKKVYMADYGLEGEELVVNATDPFEHPSLKGFIAEWKRDGSTWDTFRRACPTGAGSRRLVESLRSAEVSSGLKVQGRATSRNEQSTRRLLSTNPVPPSRELAFARDIDATFDVCASPSMHSLHSAFFSDQRAIEHLYPVFSPSKPRGFSDILIPSHHYWQPSSEFTYEWEMVKGRTSIPTDVEWSAKKPTVYWRGKVTRGADTPPGHGSSFQKQRLVKAANQATPGAEKVLVSFDAEKASLTSTSLPVSGANKAMTDVAMACDPKLGECSYLRSLGYRVEPPAPLSEAWKHKYVLDIDEIGFSPRFLALMESKSAVVKSSVQIEFWKGWIKPWKHYIPLSSAYSELLNIQTFFSGYPTDLMHNVTSNSSRPVNVLTLPSPLPELPVLADGSPFETDRALRDIAEAGTQWRAEHVRKGDMECYVYRLMIEWAALVTQPEEDV